MELSCTTVLLLAVLGVLSAQETKYFEVDQKLILKPDISAVQKPITSIRWKFGTRLVVDWTGADATYFGPFRERTKLDTKTLQLEVFPLTLNDSGAFSLETKSGSVGTYDVQVLKPPPMPKIKIQPLVCQDHCTLTCNADVNDHLGPVTYEWRKDEGEWSEDAQVKHMSTSTVREKFYCRLKTRVRSGSESFPVENPLFQPPGPGPSPTPMILGIVLPILIIVALIAIAFAMVKFCPTNRCSQIIINGFNQMTNASTPANPDPPGQPDAYVALMPAIPGPGTPANPDPNGQLGVEEEMPAIPGPGKPANPDTNGQPDANVALMPAIQGPGTPANPDTNGQPDANVALMPAIQGPETPMLNHVDHPNGQAQPDNPV